MENESALVVEMRRRIRRHMLTSFGGAIAGFAVAFGGAAAVASIAGEKSPLIAIPVLIGLAMCPGIGFASTFKNLRCPSCDRGVGWQVSANASAFGRYAQKTCPSCGNEIFPTRSVRGTFKSLFAVALALGVLLTLLAVVGGLAARSHRPNKAPATSSSP